MAPQRLHEDGNKCFRIKLHLEDPCMTNESQYVIGGSISYFRAAGCFRVLDENVNQQFWLSNGARSRHNIDL